MRIGPLRWWSSGSTHVAWGIEASIAPDDDWAHQRTQDYGASFAALRALAAQKGYRLIHVHGPRSLYFLRDDLAFPDELCIAPGFGAEELRWLTDATAFYSTFSSGGSLPGWFDAPAPDVSRAPWQLLAQPGKTAKVDIDGLSVEVLADKQDLAWYQQRKVFEESASLMYRFVRDEGFVNFVDVGANVGFISMLARRAAPALNIISIEADPRLARLIEANFSANGLERPTVVNAVVGEHAAVVRVQPEPEKHAGQPGCDERLAAGATADGEARRVAGHTAAGGANFLQDRHPGLRAAHPARARRFPGPE
jgi:FkbM family methyltransferase